MRACGMVTTTVKMSRFIQANLSFSFVLSFILLWFGKRNKPLSSLFRWGQIVPTFEQTCCYLSHLIQTCLPFELLKITRAVAVTRKVHTPFFIINHFMFTGNGLALFWKRVRWWIVNLALLTKLSGFLRSDLIWSTPNSTVNYSRSSSDHFLPQCNDFTYHPPPYVLKARVSIYSQRETTCKYRICRLVL